MQSLSASNDVQGSMNSPRKSDRSIGALLIDSGKIAPEDAERVLRYAKEKSMRFGDAAVALRVAKESDIQEVLARQFDYPYLGSGESRVSHEVIAAWKPFSAQVEALRALRSQLLLRWFSGDSGQRTLAISSSRRGDGRTHLAANLAVVFSQMGESTLLIDADLRNGRQHELFGLNNSLGLSSVLAERAGLECVQRVAGFVDLSVLAAGPTPPNPLELLGRDSFGERVSQLCAQYDVIILDTTAASLGSDCLLVGQQSKGNLLIARRHRSAIDDCGALADELRAAGSSIVGGVINDF